MSKAQLITQHLSNTIAGNPFFQSVRVATKKLAPDFPNPPETEVVIFTSSVSPSLRAWQGSKTLSKEELVVIHTYSRKSLERAEEVANAVCELLDGATPEGMRLVRVMAFPTELEYSPQESLFYANAEAY